MEIRPQKNSGKCGFCLLRVVTSGCCGNLNLTKEGMEKMGLKEMKVLVVLPLFVILLGLPNTVGAQPPESAWDELLRKYPGLQTDTTVGPLERATLQAITPQQLDDWQTGYDTSEIILPDGTTLDQFIAAAAAASSPLAFYPVTPCTAVNGTFAATNTFDFDVTPEGGDFSSQGGSSTGCGVPTDAEAVILNVKTVGVSGNGRVEVYAQDDSSSSPIENFGAGLKGNNAVPVGLCSSGCTADITLEVASGGAASTRVALQVLGYFKPVSGGGTNIIRVSDSAVLGTVVGYSWSQGWTIINNNGYVVTVDANGVPSLEYPLYNTTDCSGTPLYLGYARNANDTGAIVARPGYVFTIADIGTYYVPQNTTPLNDQTYQKKRNNSANCQSWSHAVNTVLPISANVEATTGVPDGGYGAVMVQ